MVLTPSRVRGFFCLSLLWVLSSSLHAGQDKPSKPIDMDRELASGAPADRAKSYYHYALSKWFEDQGDLSRALAEMRNALKYNASSATVRIDMANILERMGRLREAMEEAQDAVRLGRRP